MSAPQSQDAFLATVIKTAQYLSGLQGDGDRMAEIASAIAGFSAADLVAFVAAGECFAQAGEGLEPALAGALIGGLGPVVRQVIESGFLATDIVEGPDGRVLAFVALPVAIGSAETIVLLIVHARAEPLDRDQLNVYLALARLVETTVRRLKSERRLRDSEERYRSLVNTQVDMVVRFDREGEITFVNDTVCEKLARPSSALIGRSWTLLIHPDDRSAMADGLEMACVYHSYSGLVDARVGTRTGFSWYSWEIGVVVNADRSLNEIQAIGRDITQTRRMEVERLNQLLFLKTLIEAIPAAVFYKDGRGAYLGMNARCAAFLERPIESVIGKTPRELEPPELAELYERTDAEALTLRQPQVYEFRKRFSDGRERDVRVYKAPFDHADGTVGGLIGLVLDITEDTQRETELRQAHEAAEAANRAKSQFLATMSHELRTPLNAILGFTRLLKAEEHDPERREQFEIIGKAGKDLLALIESILDLSRIEAGRIKLETVNFDLDEVLDLVESLFGDQTARKKLAFRVVVAPEVPVRLHGDPRLLRQALTNLVGNAVKFTDRGYIEIRVGCFGPAAADGTVKLLFQVADTGCGISPENHQRMFEMFEQETGFLTRRAGGVGLGLAIVKRLVALLDGEIWLESTPNVGSLFSFTARFRNGADAPAPEEEPEHCPALPEPLRHQRILVVEDDLFNRQLLISVLERSWFEVVSVDNGEQALAALAKERFALVLMDIQMPVLNGLEATRRIRSGGVAGCDPRIPVIAITAFAILGDRERFLAAGLTDCVTKPIDFPQLLAVIQQHLPEVPGPSGGNWS